MVTEKVAFIEENLAKLGDFERFIASVARRFLAPPPADAGEG